MKYEVTVKDVTLDEASQIVWVVSRMGGRVPVIAESPEQHDVPDVGSRVKPLRRLRRGYGCILKSTGRRFISLVEAANYIRETRNVCCSSIGLKKAIDNGEPYMGMEFILDKTSKE